MNKRQKDNLDANAETIIRGAIKDKMKTTKTKHTPGPWECHKFKRNIESEKGYSPFEILQPLINRTGEYCGKLGGYNTVLGKRNCNQGYVLAEADARLIAAAPELLEACKKAMNECCDLIATPAGNAIETAIRKAECGAAEGGI